MPVMLYNHLGELLEGGWAISGELALCLLLNGACFHMQRVMAYAVMGLISPVSQARARARSSQPPKRASRPPEPGWDRWPQPRPHCLCLRASLSL